MFGANLIFNRDSLSGTYTTKVEALNIAHVRFPGGTLAEDVFSLVSPDTTPEARTEGLPPGLSEYLSWASTRDYAPNIIIPTKRYIGTPDLGEHELRTFIERLAAGAWGPSQGIILEIGNEYYAETPGGSAVSAEDYARVAATQISVIAELFPTARIAVQMGKGLQDNSVISRYLQESGLIEDIDYLVTHHFFFNAFSSARRFAEVSQSLAEWRSFGSDAEIYMSAWNVASTITPENDFLHDYGHKQVPALVEFLTAAVASGVQHSAIWPIQNNNKTMLTGNEGNPEIYATGAVYGLMAQHLPGHYYYGALTPTSGVTVHQFGTQEESEYVMLFSARELDQQSVDVTLSIAEQFTSGYILSSTLLSQTGDRDTPLPRQGDQAYSINQSISSFSSTAAGFTFSGFSSFDTAFIEIAGEGADGVLYGNERDNYIRGTNSNDIVYGGQGSDVVYSLRLSDSIFGGDGDDFLYGGDGRDRLFGDAGHDRIFGGNGDDRLFGGDGDDSIFGGDGDDLIFGGRGFDSLRGGQGADTFIFRASDVSLGQSGLAVIGDFNPGEGDTIDLTSIGLELSNGESVSFLVGIPLSAQGQMRWDSGSQRLELSLSDEVSSPVFLQLRSVAPLDATVVFASLRTSMDLQYISPDLPTAFVHAGSVPQSVAPAPIPRSSQLVLEDQVTSIGTENPDSLRGTSFNDIISGLQGGDTIAGFDGDDIIYGGGGRDRLFGGDGSDSLFGGNGNDRLFGGKGDDFLFGGAGNDILYSGEGYDVLHGGVGADTFVFAGSLASGQLTSLGRVDDFNSAEGDVLDLRGLRGWRGDDAEDALAFIGSAQHTEPGQVRFDTDQQVVQVSFELLNTTMAVIELRGVQSLEELHLLL